MYTCINKCMYLLNCRTQLQKAFKSSLERMTDKPTHTQHFLENSDFIVHMFLSEEL